MKFKGFDPSEWVSVGTAARLADVDRGWMRQLARNGKLRAFEIEGQWFVFRADAMAYERSYLEGRPRTKDKPPAGKATDGKARTKDAADDLQAGPGKPRQAAAQPPRAKAARRRRPPA